MAGIYVHIPFCHSKCGYCDFYSTPRMKLAESFVEALLNEWDERRGELNEKIETIYLGGGTPSSLSTTQLERVISAFPSDHLREFTIEVNPEDVTEEFAGWLKDSPIDRVSMGVQSLDDRELNAVGRKHTAKEAIEAVEHLRVKGGIDNLSLDLIYGLPYQTIASWSRSLEGILDLEPEHLSAYLLSYEPGTRLTAMVKAGKLEEATEELVTEMYGILCERTRERGMGHYEISNFARDGRRSLHNSSYWDMTPYIGLGPGAHSFNGRDRGYNPADLKGYLARGGRGWFVREEESQTERENDLIITSLRCAEGLELGNFDPVRRRSFLKAARKWLVNGELEWIKEGERIRITEEAWLVSDRILVDLID